MNVRPFLASSLIALAVSAHGAHCFADTPAQYPKSGFLLEGRAVVQPNYLFDTGAVLIYYGGGAMIGARSDRVVGGLGVDFLDESRVQEGSDYNENRSSNTRKILLFSPTVQYTFARSKGRFFEVFVQGNMLLNICFIQGEVQYDTRTVKSNRTEFGMLLAAGLGLRAWATQHVALSLPVAIGIPPYFLNITPGLTGVF